jgi:hypothetical protein
MIFLKVPIIKKFFNFLFIVIPVFVFGGETRKEHSFTVLAGNGGQINKELSSLYQFGTPGNYFYRINISFMHLNLNYEFNKNKYSLGAGTGYGRSRTVWSGLGNPTEAQLNWDFYNFSIYGVYKIIEAGKFQVESGLEGVYYLTGDQTMNFTKPTVEEKYRMEGGRIFGINHLTSAKFYITPRFFVRSDVSYGLLVYDIGGKYTLNTYYSTYREEMKYFLTKMSRPGVFFGIGFKF